MVTGGGRVLQSREIKTSDVLEPLKFPFVSSPCCSSCLFLVLFWCYRIEKRLRPWNLVLKAKSKRKGSVPVSLESCWGAAGREGLVLGFTHNERCMRSGVCAGDLFTAPTPTETCSLVLSEIHSDFKNITMFPNYYTSVKLLARMAQLMDCFVFFHLLLTYNKPYLLRFECVYFAIPPCSKNKNNYKLN